MKVVKDPVHGYILLDGLALELIDTPEVQRLRRIRQLGLSNFVYPGANHTRFEHSLGTLHLVDMLLKTLSIDDKERDEVRAAALLHDIGHGPFSHSTEGILERYTGKNHDDVGEIIMMGEIADILESRSIDPSHVSKLILGETPLGQLINSELDADRMDYLVRDAYYTGVAYGVIDYVRLIYEMEFRDELLVVREGGLQAAESLLISRFLMHPTVYFHHVSRIGEAMLSHATEALIEAGLEPSMLKRMDDSELMATLRSAKGYPHDIAERMDRRRLFKRAIYMGKDSVDIERVLEFQNQSKKIESEMAREAGLPEGYVLLDIPKLLEIAEGRSKIVIKDEMKHLDEVSQLVRTLVNAQWDNWKLGVYTPEEHRAKVEKVARDYLVE
ncbi:MAG: HD domain-containing protein [Methanocellales archaeon]|nr:HD domain-containing protein [Methanocellales archaeon]MDD3291366.1 HD domain-containing protein [Methanocellales archaeon]MDD5234744.1 HD domain-containing protein [Methanocellales archaeon]MDD5484905.1 HD domain-containing protein [Methanocellales archaeon]